MTAFIVLKNQIRAQLTIVNDAVKLYNNEMERVSEGPKYDNDRLVSTFNWLKESISKLEHLHIKGLGFAETCPCGSEIIPHALSEDEEPICRDCEGLMTLESNGC